MTEPWVIGMMEGRRTGRKTAAKWRDQAELVAIASASELSSNHQTIRLLTFR